MLWVVIGEFGCNLVSSCHCCDCGDSCCHLRSPCLFVLVCLFLCVERASGRQRMSCVCCLFFFSGFARFPSTHHLYKRKPTFTGPNGGLSNHQTRKPRNSSCCLVAPRGRSEPQVTSSLPSNLGCSSLRGKRSLTFCRLGNGIWLRVKKYPKSISDKWNQSLKPAAPWWVYFDPCPFVSKLSKGRFGQLGIR